MSETSDLGTFGRFEETSVRDMPPDMKEAYDFTMKLRGLVPGPHRIWLDNPELSKTVVPIGAYYPTRSTLTKPEIEIATNLVNGRWLTAGDNPERLRSEASFASLCGVSPVPASSEKTVRHRLNRGGDRAANSALHIIAIGRLRTDHRTKDYVARRIAEGHSKLDGAMAESW
jgi:hypothetical protein